MKSTLFFFVRIGAVLSEIVLVPSNTAVMVGEKMDMNCLTTNHSAVLKWLFYNSSRTTSTIYRKGSSGRLRGQFEHFGVEIHANGPVMISANSTRSSDAGIYRCQCEIDGKDAEYSAHLIVLESLPVCESNITKNYNFIDGDYIWIQCNISFRGFWSPSMKWIRHGPQFRPEGKSVTDGIETIISPRQSVTSKLTIVVNSSTNGSYYSCKIYFANYSDTEVTTANNVPKFTHTWNTSVLYVSNSTMHSVSADTSSTTEKSSSVDWYLVSLSLVAGMAVFFILVVALAIARYIRSKKKVSVGDINEHSTLTNNHQRNQSIPVYAEVNKMAKEKKIPGQSDQIPFPTNSKPKQNYAGANGTQYMELDSLTELKANGLHVKRPPMFDLVETYASIDHTVAVPPPSPPPLVPRRH